MWTIKLSQQADQFLSNTTGKARRQLENGLQKLQLDANAGKPLKGDLKGYWSFRVGDYRMIYSIHHQVVTVMVLRIQHRKEVYERMK